LGLNIGSHITVGRREAPRLRKSSRKVVEASKARSLISQVCEEPLHFLG
jgi:hypothetical protein